MPKIKLTAAAVARLKAPASGQVDYFDAGFPALALRITAGDVRSWVYFGRVYGKLKRATLGRFPALSLHEARRKAGQVADAMRDGIDPAAAKREARNATRDSFAAVADEWLKRDQGKNRSAAHVRAVVERYMLPAWSDRAITTIGRRDVIELIDSVADRYPTMAHRLHAHLHRLFRWSVGRGVLAFNPMADLPRQGAVVKRDRVLSDRELALVWQAATTWPFGPITRLLILTGARREEIGGLRWSEVHENAIRLEGARTKNGEPHAIPLAPQAAAIIEGLPRMARSDFVFSTTGETSVSGWSKAKAALDSATKKLNHGHALPDWRLHDLRRTVATGLQRLGVNLQVIEAILGHVAGSRAGVVGVYQRYSFEPEMKAALEAWARHVEALGDAKPSKVIPMAGRARA